MKQKGELAENTIAATVMSNLGLFKALDAKGISYVKTDVGDKYVYEAMQNKGLCLGGEESGHIIFSKYATTGDGLITALKIMEVFIESKLPASKLCEGFTRYPQLVKNVRVEDKDAVVNDPDVQNALAFAKEQLGDNGRILLRKSGTEPVVRVMVEAMGENLCEALAKKVVDVIETKGLAVR